MINSIKYFEENSIKIFEKLETEFMNDPTKLAELVYGVTEEVHKLGLKITRLTSHMLDSTDDARKEIYDAIRSDNLEEFISITERLKDALRNPEIGRKRDFVVHRDHKK